MTATYPWSAVVGQASLKRALLLCAIDPALGGVLIRGPRGVAKTTLARALGELVPGRFVELPLGATEERVTGTLDLEAALRDRQVAFSPGLLARAHEGVLYVDEVNLLPDPLVDLLLDAAASGQNVVERDGVSHAHAARFVLIGTMNPEEGELRPQLIDRFGLSVTADADIRPAERTEIVARRLAFERDPAAFVAACAAEQTALAQRCAAARERAAALPLEGRALQWVAERCYAAGVEGVRADLAMLRAARAHAAWEGRGAIAAEDVAAVAELALAHRRREPRPPDGSDRGRPFGKPPAARETALPPVRPSPAGPAASPRSAESQAPGGGAGAQPRGDGEHGGGALAAVPVPWREIPVLPAWLAQVPASRAELRRRGRAAPRQRVRAGRARGGAPGGAVDWFATLCRSARPRRADLRYRSRGGPPRQLWIAALDCSASMLRAGALAAGKGAASALAAAALARAAHFALLSFRAAESHTEVSPERDPRAVPRALDELRGGGGTPLARALLAALALCRQRPWRSRDAGKRLVLLTDGRSSEDVGGFAALLRRHGVQAVVIDCERAAVRLGRCAELAAALGARLLHVDALARAPYSMAGFSRSGMPEIRQTTTSAAAPRS